MKKAYVKSFETQKQALAYYSKVKQTQAETRQYKNITMGFNGKWFVTWSYK